MNLNIEQCSQNKVNIPGMAAALARTVAAANVDILILLEVKKTNVAAAMTTFSNALNAASGGNNWRGHFLSNVTGTEHYCAFVRNLDFIRPVLRSSGPAGNSNNPLRDLTQNVFRVWPSADWATTAYPVPANPPRISLCDLFAAPRRPRAAKRANFGGQTIGGGGYSLGRGYRLPALMMFLVHGGVGDYLVPYVVCHYAATRSGARNPLGQSQVHQLMYLHIAQLFDDNPPGGQRHFLDVLDLNGDHTAKGVCELCFTGDFNLDFLVNSSAAGASALQRTNRNAFDAVTPTQQQGGSAPPPVAAPGAAAAVPALPYGPPWPAPRSISVINQQRLRAAVTTQGTIQRKYPLPAPPPAAPPPAPYADAALDNFFYGGTRLTTAAAAFGVGGADAGEAVNVPAMIVQQGGAAAPGQLDVSAIAAHYQAAGTHNAANAPGLQAAAGGGAPPLTDDERLIGARFLTDHLPVVLGFDCP